MIPEEGGLPLSISVETLPAEVLTDHQAPSGDSCLWWDLHAEVASRKQNPLLQPLNLIERGITLLECHQ